MTIDKEELEERVAMLLIDNDVEITEDLAYEQAEKELQQRTYPLPMR